MIWEIETGQMLGDLKRWVDSYVIALPEKCRLDI